MGDMLSARGPWMRTGQSTHRHPTACSGTCTAAGLAASALTAATATLRAMATLLAMATLRAMATLLAMVTLLATARSPAMPTPGQVHRDYPYACCEMGRGIQVWYRYRLSCLQRASRPWLYAR